MGDTQVKEVTLDECLDEVAALSQDCGKCNSTESKKAYQVRLGIWHSGEQAVGAPGEADASAHGETDDEEETDAGVVAWNADENWGHGKVEVECKSIDAMSTDHWCQTTCGGDGTNCPKAMCECTTFSGARLKERAEEQLRT